MSRVPPQDLEAALRRLGLASAIRLSDYFFNPFLISDKESVLKRMLLVGYSRSTKVSVISFFLHKRSVLDASKVMLAGLLQDIALPAILKELSGRPDIFRNPLRLTQAVDRLAPMVGVLILKNWRFDDELIEVVRSRKEWQRDQCKAPDMADIVLIARL